MSANGSAALRTLCGVAAAVVLSSMPGPQPSAQERPRDLPASGADWTGSAPPALCATLDPVAEAALRFRPRQVLQNNIPLSFDQDPVLLTGNYQGVVTLQNFLVTGDLASLDFKPVGSDAIETWTRTAITQIGNRTLSVFSPSWAPDQWPEAYQSQQVGFDSPYLFWGEVLPPGTPPGTGYSVYLRVTSNSIPSVTVVRAADDVQYSSSIVNIRLDDFGNTLLLEDENYYAFDRITKRFYELFQDSYDSIGITTGSVRLASQSGVAFHQRVRNDIRGIGQPLFDNSAAYGSAGRLSGIEFFSQTFMASNRSLAHETAHRWAAFIDWSRLLGIVGAGHQPGSHDPLMSGGETRMGAVLEGTRRVENASGAWTIQRTPPPIRFHPYTLYAMGLLPAGSVPEVTIFDDQGQFGSSSTATPAIGTAVAGTTRSATAFNVIGMLGAREGPVAAKWDQALVVVSSGRLLSPREMDYWTFYAQRTEDPNGSGVVSWNGHGSFDIGTSRAIDLTHEIRPRDREPIREPLPVDFPRLAPTDFRDVLPDASVATLYDAGERMRMTGVVTAKDHDFNEVLVRLRRYTGGTADVIRVSSGVTRNGSFEAVFPVFTPEQKGQWLIDVYLFWPSSGNQFPRISVGPVTVR